MPIPLVVTLWSDINFTGHRRVIVADVGDLNYMVFNDIASSVQVHEGPDYATMKNAGEEPTISLYRDKWYSGANSTSLWVTTRISMPRTTSAIPCPQLR